MIVLTNVGIMCRDVLVLLSMNLSKDGNDLFVGFVIYFYMIQQSPSLNMFPLIRMMLPLCLITTLIICIIIFIIPLMW